MIDGIKDHLLDYLAGRITLEQFEDWFVLETWDEKEADHLATEIDLRLAEHSNGHLPEDQLKEEFRALHAWTLPPRDFSTVEPTITTSSGSTMTVSIGPTLEVVGIRP